MNIKYIKRIKEPVFLMLNGSHQNYINVCLDFRNFYLTKNTIFLKGKYHLSMNN